MDDLKQLIIGDYKITTDAYNFIVSKARIIEQKGSKNFGKLVYGDNTYHVTFQQAMDRVANNNIIDGFPDIKNILDRLNNIEEVSKDIKSWKK